MARSMVEWLGFVEVTYGSTQGTPEANMPKKTLNDRILDAEEKGNRALADANEAAERGAKKTAERLYERGQRWLGKANELRGWN